jgi:hypothetical protein
LKIPVKERLQEIPIDAMIPQFNQEHPKDVEMDGLYLRWLGTQV